ncbi:MAG: hypothetical protein PHY30_00780 [Candidatus Pacebacteria bacterium]|nr:hypothetical protein [Candidatus Paceibacterota bacterium]
MNGIHPMGEVFPCTPQDIRIPRYTLLGTLQHAEPEEAAARILTFSQEAGKWVGVSASKLDEMVQADLKQERDRREKCNEYGRKKRDYAIKCLFTFGLYAVFVQKPVWKSEEPLPFSLVYMMGMNAIVQGIYQLHDKGYLRLDEGILYPTEDLVRRIMEVQGIPCAENAS